MSHARRYSSSMDYDEFAPTYAWARQPHAWVLDPLVRFVRDLPANTAVLEIGCGTGNYVRALAESCLALACVGLDLSAPMLREARASGSRVELVQGDASVAFPFADQAFHFVFAVDVVHHIGDLPRFFAEAHRVLSPGGRLVLFTDSEDTLKRRGLTIFFPEILSVELERYPTIESLHDEANRSGFRLLGAGSASGLVPLDDRFVTSLAARCASSMRLITPAEHEAGMARVRSAQARGESWFSCYDVLEYVRPGPGAASA
jgi:SAM-dependent methyltransferase